MDGETQLVGILGHGIEYTMSPAIHNAAFRKLGMNWAYVPLRVSLQQLEPALRGLCALGFRGCNVTIPYKMEVVRYLDGLREPAGRLGAVNTVICGDGGMVGYNTDVEGFRSFLADTDARVEGSTVLLIGAGGASRAVALALVEEGAARIFVMNRTGERAEELAALLKTVNPATEISVRTFDLEGSRVLEESDVVVNCTPLAGSDADETAPRLQRLYCWQMGNRPQVCRRDLGLLEKGERPGSENGRRRGHVAAPGRRFLQVVDRTGGSAARDAARRTAHRGPRNVTGVFRYAET